MPASLSSRRPPSRWPLRRRPSLRQHLLPPLPPRVPIMTWTPASQSAAQRRGLHLPGSGGAGHGRARSPQEAGAGHLERKRRQRACGDACAGFSGSGDRLSQSKGPVPSGPRTDKGAVSYQRFYRYVHNIRNLRLRRASLPNAAARRRAVSAARTLPQCCRRRRPRSIRGSVRERERLRLGGDVGLLQR